MKLSFFASIAIEVINLQTIKRNLYRNLRWGNIHSVEKLNYFSFRCIEIDNQIKTHLSFMQIGKKVIS